MVDHFPSRSLRAHLRGSWRVLLKELAAFGIVGAAAFVMDVGVFNLLAHLGWLRAKAVSATVSTAFAYFGNRHVSFSHRARTGIRRETAVFLVINTVAIAFSLLTIALFDGPFHERQDHVVMNLVNLATIALCTVFRFWAYKRFVFVAEQTVRPPEPNLAGEVVG